MPTARPTGPRRAFSLGEVAAALAVTATLLAVTLPAIGGARDQSMASNSIANLRTLGVAAGTYADDWNRRAFTTVRDDIQEFGSNASAFLNVQSVEGTPHPPLTLGWGPRNDGSGTLQLFAYRLISNFANARLTEPIVFEGPNYAINGFFGSFRLPSDARFAAYVGGRFYDQTFYAPEDDIVIAAAGPLIDEPWPFTQSPEVTGFGNSPYWSSYCWSAAGMFDPAVLASRRFENGRIVGGYRDPWTVDDAFRVPTVDAVRYPALKTQLLEHQWLRTAPEDPCWNPTGWYGGCEPWYFNHGIDAAPAALLHDGSTRMIPNLEAVASDQTIRDQTGGLDGTWSRSTPWGDDGYFSEFAYDADLRISHHVLTADGVLGRDTLGADAVDASRLPSRFRQADPSLRRTIEAATALRFGPGERTDFGEDG